MNIKVPIIVEVPIDKIDYVDGVLHYEYEEEEVGKSIGEYLVNILREKLRDFIDEAEKSKNED